MSTTKDRRLQIIVDMFADLGAGPVHLGGNVEGVEIDMTRLGHLGSSIITADDEAPHGHYIVSYCRAGRPAHDHAEHDVTCSVPIEGLRATIIRLARDEPK